MSECEKKELVKQLGEVDKVGLWRPEVQEYVMQMYIRIWISLCLDCKISITHAASPTSNSHKAILPTFKKAIKLMGLHTMGYMDWDMSRLASLASMAWGKAQHNRPPQEPMLSGPPASPGYVQALEDV